MQNKHTSRQLSWRRNGCAIYARIDSAWIQPILVSYWFMWNITVLLPYFVFLYENLINSICMHTRCDTVWNVWTSSFLTALPIYLLGVRSRSVIPLYNGYQLFFVLWDTIWDMRYETSVCKSTYLLCLRISVNKICELLLPITQCFHDEPTHVYNSIIVVSWFRGYIWLHRIPWHRSRFCRTS